MIRGRRAGPAGPRRRRFEDLFCEVTCTRNDGSCLTVPFANVLKLEGPLVREYLVYASLK